MGDMKKTGVINVRRPQQLRLKVGDFLRTMCEAKGKSMKEKSDGNRDCGWLCQHRGVDEGIFPPPPTIEPRSGGKTCNPRKQDPQYLTCKHDSYSIFEERTWKTDW